jgi:hypothetical protein
VSSTGVVTGVAAGTATITATSEGVSGTAAITVTPAPPPSALWPNEPPGMTVITERAFNAKGEDHWSDEPSPNYSIVQDSDAPKSPTSVGQALYPAGFVAGSEPISLNRNLGTTYHTLYVSFWFKFSPNFVGQPATNKIFHIFIADVNRVFLYLLGGGSQPLSPQFELQQVPVAGGARDLPPNVQPNFVVQRGRWYRWEFVLTSNTGDNADGKLDWWIDGVKMASYSDLQITRSSQSNIWQILQWAPTWGGIGGVVPADQYERVDHIYISGK